MSFGDIIRGLAYVHAECQRMLIEKYGKQKLVRCETAYLLAMRGKDHARKYAERNGCDRFFMEACGL